MYEMSPTLFQQCGHFFNWAPFHWKVFTCEKLAVFHKEKSCPAKKYSFNSIFLMFLMFNLNSSSDQLNF